MLFVFDLIMVNYKSIIKMNININILFLFDLIMLKHKSIIKININIKLLGFVYMF